MSDAINPSHYKHLPVEAIEIIEAAIAKAPSNEAAYLHGQVLKYLLRCWEKKGIEDLRKAKWYLDRLIKSFDDILAEINAPILEGEQSSTEPPNGWRWIEVGEVFCDTDSTNTVDAIPSGWIGAVCAVKHVAFRKTEKPPKRYREPTLEDLANGPIECEVGDNHEKRTLIYVFPYEPGRARFAAVDKANPNCVGRWIDCQIEVQE